MPEPKVGPAETVELEIPSLRRVSPSDESQHLRQTGADDLERVGRYSLSFEALPGDKWTPWPFGSGPSVDELVEHANRTGALAGIQHALATMQTWLQDWYGISYAPEMTQGDMQRMERMSEMYGAEFEIAFMKSMIRHHWKAVVRASGCLDRAYHPELIAMCEEIIIAQVGEIEILRMWLCRWYGLCNYGPKGKVAETH